MTTKSDKRPRTPASTPSPKPQFKKSSQVTTNCKGKLSFDKGVSKHSLEDIDVRQRQRDTEFIKEAIEEALSKQATPDRILAALVKAVTKLKKQWGINDDSQLLGSLFPDYKEVIDAIRETFEKLDKSNSETARQVKAAIACSLISDDPVKAKIRRMFGVGRRILDQAVMMKKDFYLAETAEAAARALLAKPRANRCDRVTPEIDADIRKYFDEHSTNSTRKRDGNYGKRKNKEGVPKKLLDGSVNEIYRRWCIERRRYGQKTVSYTQFANRRPEHIKIRSMHDRIVCTCVKDTNANYMLQALESFRSKHTRSGTEFTHNLPRHMSDLLAECTCVPDESNDPDRSDVDFLETDIDCINGKCDKCGTAILDRYAMVNGDQETQTRIWQSEVVYKQIRSVTESVRDEHDESVTKQLTKTDAFQDKATLREFLNLFKLTIADHVQHMFRYRWQKAQLADKINMLQLPGHIAVAMDFSENHTVLEPIEAQSLHWSKEQLAILVMIVYSLSSRANNRSGTPDSVCCNNQATSHVQPVASDDPSVDMEQFFFVSKVLAKGCEFVNTCILKLIKHLLDDDREVDHIHFISDGCAADFKSNHSMLDRAMLWMSSQAQGHKVTCTVNFSESGHGKGPWDGAGGWLKGTLHMLAVNKGQVIREPSDVAQLVNSQYSTPASHYNRKRLLVRRHCFVVEEGEVDYDVTTRAKADLKGIRGMHQFDCPGGNIMGVNDLNVSYRKLSCYCERCIDRDFPHCLNRRIVGVMERLQMRPDSEATQDRIEGLRQQLDCWEQEVTYGTIVQAAAGRRFPSQSDTSWVAVYHRDEEYDEYLYYVMWVNEGPVVLSRSTTDGYGSRFSAKSTVLKGHYLSLCCDDDGRTLPESEGRYTLDTEKAICDVRSVVYSGFGVEIAPEGARVVYKINHVTQREIRDRVNAVLT